ncbi:ABC transporter permease [Geobacillus thermodenitrificans]|uniref:ABC transporter permease n=1 Tax=Geobacillus thermodenitrificans TaxID=33940 RepID=UPI002E1E26DA|nr:ABC transporter permease [Geobacillus thermodenitrificans]
MAILLNNKMPLWLSGLIICIFGPVLALIIGTTLVKYNHSQGGTSEGAGYAAAFIGLMIIGIISKINHFLKDKPVSSAQKKNKRCADIDQHMACSQNSI